MSAMDMARARQRAEAEPVYLAEITPLGAGAPVMRFATRQVSVGGLDYEAYLLGVGGASGGLRRGDSRWLNSTLRLWFSNEPWRGFQRLVEAGEDYPLGGAFCVLSETYIIQGGATVTPVEIFRGLLEGPSGVDMGVFYSDVTGLGMRHRKFLDR